MNYITELQLYTIIIGLFTSRFGGTKRKPTVIADYNKYMLGVDKLDQLTSYYSFLHKSVKWWRKVFFWILEVAVVNSYILYKEQTTAQRGKPIPHLIYRRNVIIALSEPIRSTAIPRRINHGGQSIERLKPIPHYLEKGEKRRDCKVCSRRSDAEGKRHLTLYNCATCTDKPPLCPSECFKVYHTHKHYQQ